MGVFISCARVKHYCLYKWYNVLTTDWELPGDCLKIAWWLSYESLMRACWFPGNWLMTVIWIPDDCLMTAQQLPEDWLMTAWYCKMVPINQKNWEAQVMSLPYFGHLIISKHFWIRKNWAIYSFEATEIKGGRFCLICFLL